MGVTAFDGGNVCPAEYCALYPDFACCRCWRSTGRRLAAALILGFKLSSGVLFLVLLNQDLRIRCQQSGHQIVDLGHRKYDSQLTQQAGQESF